MNRKNWSLVALLLVAACGSDQANSGGFAAGDAGTGLPECFSSNECPTGYTCSEFGNCMPPIQGGPDAGGDPAEIEVERSAPVHSDRFVYVAMSELDSLAKIDGLTLEVSSIAVGDQPKVLAAIPNSDGVVVLDRNNGTVAIVRPSGAIDDTRVVPTLANMNRLSVDPTGSYALAWFDLRKEIKDAGGLSNSSVIGSFQDVTVIRLAQDAERSVDLTVGFRPREVEFAADGSRAFVITDDGISVISLADVIDGGPSIVAPFNVQSDPLTDPLDLEVNIVASGDYAVVREELKAELRVVQLSAPGAGAMSILALPAAPTDVDLATDGSAAYAVLRDTSELAIIDLSQGLPDDSNVELIALGGDILGSMVLSPGDQQAVLFTNASSQERLTLIDLIDIAHPVQTFGLQKSVRSLGYDPTGTSLIVTHAKSFGDPLENGISFEEFIDRSFGYSIVNVATGFSKLQITSADPGFFSFSATTPRAYVLLDGGDADGATAETHIIELDTGVVRVQKMNSPPETIGILPNAGMAFINQRHPLGRVSFINVVTDAMRTVTGFDLNSRIVD